MRTNDPDFSAKTAEVPEIGRASTSEVSTTPASRASRRPRAEMSLARPGLAGAEGGAGRFRRLVFGGMACEMTTAAPRDRGDPT